MARRGSPTQLPLGDVDMSVYGFGDEASRKVRWVGPPEASTLPRSLPVASELLIHLRRCCSPPRSPEPARKAHRTFQSTTYDLLTAPLTVMCRISCPARLPTRPIIPSATR